VAIHPTPVVGVLGVLDDVSRRTPSGWREPGQAIYLLGATRPEFGGSEWAWAEHGHLGGLPPACDLDAERRLAQVLIAGNRDGLLGAAHDLSDGGLAQALVEGCLRHGVGAQVSLEPVCSRDGVSAFAALYAESTARCLVAVSPAHEAALIALAVAHDVPVARLGAVSSEAVLEVSGQFSIGLDELGAAHRGTLPAVFGP